MSVSIFVSLSVSIYLSIYLSISVHTFLFKQFHISFISVNLYISCFFLFLSVCFYQSIYQSINSIIPNWMLRAILNKSWQQHPTRRQLYGHLPPITKNIHARRTRHAGHCWRSKDKIVSDVLLWTPAYGQSKAGQPARTYIQQLCDDTGCNPEDLPEAMNDRETWRERGSGISVLAAWHDDDDFLSGIL